MKKFEFCIFSTFVEIFLKITIVAPRNLGQNFKRLYDFLWRYERDDIIYAQRYDNKESPKKFWATFVANLLFNKRICKIWHHFFCKNRTVCQNDNFFWTKWLQLHYILFLRSLTSYVSTKKILMMCGQKAHTKIHQKKF